MRHGASPLKAAGPALMDHLTIDRTDPLWDQALGSSQGLSQMVPVEKFGEQLHFRLGRASVKIKVKKFLNS